MIRGIYEFWRRGRRTIGLMVVPAVKADADAILAALEQVAPRARRQFDVNTGAPIDAPPT